MQLYKLNVEISGGFFLKLNSLEEAKTYNSYVILFENYIISIDEKIESDKSFCLYLMDRFIKQNREAGITEPQSEALLAQFKDIMSMAQVGAVPSVYALLQNVTVGETYTQARKDKDLADLLNYMNS